jgi:beta-glucanase (GH16 family)
MAPADACTDVTVHPRRAACRPTAGAIAAWLFAVVAAALSGPASAAAETLAVPAGWTLAWSDEFDVDGAPDARKWQPDTGMNRAGWHNHEQQYYAGRQGTNARVHDGRLFITARREALRQADDWGGQPYTSARLITRGLAEWTTGFVEVRAKLPCARGTWPAIWMLGTQGDWPLAGELDIMEYVGRNPGRVFSTVHTAAGHGGNGVGGTVGVPDACSAFHRYQMRWTKDDVVFGVDGFDHLRYPRLAGGASTWPFDAPQFLILNVAVGGDLGGPVDEDALPATMEVDYVRVWQDPAAPGR